MPYHDPVKHPNRYEPHMVSMPPFQTASFIPHKTSFLGNIPQPNN